MKGKHVVLRAWIMEGGRLHCLVWIKNGFPSEQRAFELRKEIMDRNAGLRKQGVCEQLEVGPCSWHSQEPQE